MTNKKVEIIFTTFSIKSTALFTKTMVQKLGLIIAGVPGEKP